MRLFTWFLIAMVVFGCAAFCGADEFGTASPLVAAAAAGRLAEVQALLAAGADPNPPKIGGAFTPYEAAVWNEQPEVAAYLAAQGADPSNAVRPPPGVVSGAVLDEAQAPLAGVLVELRPLAAVEPNHRRYPSLTDTDPQGRFRFIHQVPGPYLVKLRGNHPGQEIAVTEETPVATNVILRVTQAANRSQHLLNALYYGQPERIHPLLEAGADPNARDEEGTPALVRAARAGYLDAVKTLIAAGAALDAQDAQGKTALDRATLESREDVIACLLEKGAPPSAEQLPPRGAIRGLVLDEDGRPLANVALKLSRDASSEKRRWESWTETDVDGRFEFPHLEPDLYFVGLANLPGENTRAALAHRTAVVEGLELRTTKNAILNQRLLAAGYGSDAAGIQQLLADGAEVDARADNGETPLMRAARGSNLEGMQALLAAGADVNAQDSDGESVLVKAVPFFRWGQKPISADPVKILVEAGANVNAEDPDGRSPLWHAIERDHDDLIALLREHGAKEPIAPLSPRGVIRGTVLDENGNPIPGATVQSARVAEIGKPRFSGFGYTSGTADENGRFEFRRLETGIYQVRSGNLADPPREIAIETRTARVENVVFRSSPRIEEGQKLVAAALADDLVNVKTFLAAGADVNAIDRHTDLTALWLAVSQKNPEMVSVLLDAGASLEPPTKTRRPPLVLAAGAGNLDMVEILVQAGANLEAQDFQGRTAMDEAVWYNHAPVAAYLAEKGAQPSTLGPRPLGAIRGIVRDENDAPLDDISVGLIQRAEDGRITHTYSLDSEPDGQFEWRGLSPGTYEIHLRGTNAAAIPATLESRTSVVDHIELRTTLSAERDQDLIQAAIFEDKERLARLLAEGASLTARDRRGHTAFGAAFFWKKPESARILAAAGADVDVMDSDGDTPLTDAANDWNLENIRLLLELGADLNVKNRAGESALTRATRRIVRWRKAAEGETPDRVDDRGLSWIRQEECPECVRLLLNAHADTETRNAAGRTPLMECALGGRIASVQLLLDADAKVNAQDPEGRSALWYAMKHRRTEIAARLRAFGAMEPENPPPDDSKKKQPPGSQAATGI